MSTKVKLAKLLKAAGYDDVWKLMEHVLGDVVSPGICMNKDCDYIIDVEPDQRRGYCDECRTNSVKAALVLAGLI